MADQSNRRKRNRRNKQKQRLNATTESYIQFKNGLNENLNISNECGENEEIEDNREERQGNEEFLNITINIKAPVPSGSKKELINSFVDKLNSISLRNTSLISNTTQNDTNKCEFIMPRPIKIEEESNNEVVNEETYTERIRNEFGINIEGINEELEIKREDDDFLSIISDIGSSTVNCSDQIAHFRSKKLKKIKFNQVEGQNDFYIMHKANSLVEIVNENNSEQEEKYLVDVELNNSHLPRDKCDEINKSANRENLNFEETVQNDNEINLLNNENIEDKVNLEHDNVLSEDLNKNDNLNAEKNSVKTIEIVHKITPSVQAELCRLNADSEKNVRDLSDGELRNSPVEKSLTNSKQDKNEPQNEISPKISTSKMLKKKKRTEISNLEKETSSEKGDDNNKNLMNKTKKSKDENINKVCNESSIKREIETNENIVENEKIIKTEISSNDEVNPSRKKISISERRKMKKYKKQREMMAVNDTVGFINSNDAMTTHEMIDLVMDMYDSHYSEESQLNSEQSQSNIPKIEDQSSTVEQNSQRNKNKRCYFSDDVETKSGLKKDVQNDADDTECDCDKEDDCKDHVFFSDSSSDDDILIPSKIKSKLEKSKKNVEARIEAGILKNDILSDTSSDNEEITLEKSKISEITELSSGEKSSENNSNNADLIKSSKILTESQNTSLSSDNVISTKIQKDSSKSVDEGNKENLKSKNVPEGPNDILLSFHDETVNLEVENGEGNRNKSNKKIENSEDQKCDVSLEEKIIKSNSKREIIGNLTNASLDGEEVQKQKEIPKSSKRNSIKENEKIIKSDNSKEDTEIPKSSERSSIKENEKIIKSKKEEAEIAKSSKRYATRENEKIIKSNNSNGERLKRLSDISSDDEEVQSQKEIPKSSKRNSIKENEKIIKSDNSKRETVDNISGTSSDDEEVQNEKDIPKSSKENSTKENEKIKSKNSKEETEIRKSSKTNVAKENYKIIKFKNSKEETEIPKSSKRNATRENEKIIKSNNLKGERLQSLSDISSDDEEVQNQKDIPKSSKGNSTKENRKIKYKNSNEETKIQKLSERNSTNENEKIIESKNSKGETEISKSSERNFTRENEKVIKSKNSKGETVDNLSDTSSDDEEVQNEKDIPKSSKETKRNATRENEKIIKSNNLKGERLQSLSDISSDDEEVQNQKDIPKSSKGNSTKENRKIKYKNSNEETKIQKLSERNSTKENEKIKSKNSKEETEIQKSSKRNVAKENDKIIKFKNSKGKTEIPKSSKRNATTDNEKIIKSNNLKVEGLQSISDTSSDDEEVQNQNEIPKSSKGKSTKENEKIIKTNNLKGETVESLSDSSSEDEEVQNQKNTPKSLKENSTKENEKIKSKNSKEDTEIQKSSKRNVAKENDKIIKFKNSKGKTEIPKSSKRYTTKENEKIIKTNYSKGESVESLSSEDEEVQSQKNVPKSSKRNSMKENEKIIKSGNLKEEERKEEETVESLSDSSPKDEEVQNYKNIPKPSKENFRQENEKIIKSKNSKGETEIQKSSERSSTKENEKIIKSKNSKRETEIPKSSERNSTKENAKIIKSNSSKEETVESLSDTSSDDEEVQNQKDIPKSSKGNSTKENEKIIKSINSKEQTIENLSDSSPDNEKIQNQTDIRNSSKENSTEESEKIIKSKNSKRETEIPKSSERNFTKENEEIIESKNSNEETEIPKSSERNSTRENEKIIKPNNLKEERLQSLSDTSSDDEEVQNQKDIPKSSKGNSTKENEKIIKSNNPKEQTIESLSDSSSDNEEMRNQKDIRNSSKGKFTEENEKIIKSKNSKEETEITKSSERNSTKENEKLIKSKNSKAETEISKSSKRSSIKENEKIIKSKNSQGETVESLSDSSSDDEEVQNQKDVPKSSKGNSIKENEKIIKSNNLKEQTIESLSDSSSDNEEMRNQKDIRNSSKGKFTEENEKIIKSKNSNEETEIPKFSERNSTRENEKIIKSKNSKGETVESLSDSSSDDEEVQNQKDVPKSSKGNSIKENEKIIKSNNLKEQTIESLSDSSSDDEEVPNQNDIRKYSNRNSTKENEIVLSEDSDNEDILCMTQKNTKKSVGNKTNLKYKKTNKTDILSDDSSDTEENISLKKQPKNSNSKNSLKEKLTNSKRPPNDILSDDTSTDEEEMKNQRIIPNKSGSVKRKRGKPTIKQTRSITSKEKLNKSKKFKSVELLDTSLSSDNEESVKLIRKNDERKSNHENSDEELSNWRKELKYKDKCSNEISENKNAKNIKETSNEKNSVGRKTSKEEGNKKNNQNISGNVIEDDTMSAQEVLDIVMNAYNDHYNDESENDSSKRTEESKVNKKIEDGSIKNTRIFKKKQEESDKSKKGKTLKKNQKDDNKKKLGLKNLLDSETVQINDSIIENKKNHEENSFIVCLNNKYQAKTSTPKPNSTLKVTKNKLDVKVRKQSLRKNAEEKQNVPSSTEKQNDLTSTNKTSSLKKKSNLISTNKPSSTEKQSDLPGINNVSVSEVDKENSNVIPTQEILGIVMEAFGDAKSDKDKLEKVKTNNKSAEKQNDLASTNKSSSTEKQSDLSNTNNVSVSEVDKENSNVIPTQEILGIVMDALGDDKLEKVESETNNKLAVKTKTPKKKSARNLSTSAKRKKSINEKQTENISSDEISTLKENQSDSNKNHKKIVRRSPRKKLQNNNEDQQEINNKKDDDSKIPEIQETPQITDESRNKNKLKYKFDLSKLRTTRQSLNSATDKKNNLITNYFENNKSTETQNGNEANFEPEKIALNSESVSLSTINKKEVQNARRSPRIKEKLCRQQDEPFIIQEEKTGEANNSPESENIIPSSQLSSTDENEENRSEDFGLSDELRCITSEDVLQQQNEKSLTKNTNEKGIFRLVQNNEDKNTVSEEIVAVDIPQEENFAKNKEKEVDRSSETQRLSNAIENQIEKSHMSQQSDISLIIPENIEECMSDFSIEPNILTDSLIGQCGDQTFGNSHSPDIVPCTQSQECDGIQIGVKRSLTEEENDGNVSKKFKEQKNERSTVAGKKPKKLPPTILAFLNRSSSKEVEVNKPHNEEHIEKTPKKKKSSKAKIIKLVKKTVEDILESRLGKKRKLEPTEEKSKRFKRILNTSSDTEDFEEGASSSISSDEEFRVKKVYKKRNRRLNSSKRYSTDERKEILIECLDKLKNTKLRHVNNSSVNSENNSNSENSDVDASEISGEFLNVLKEARVHVQELTCNEQLKNLKINIDFEIPAAHQIAVRLAGTPSKAQYEKLAQHEVKIREGKFTEKDDFLIYTNFSKFCEVYNLEDDPLPFLNMGVDCLLPYQEKLKFVQYIGRGLGDRYLHAIHMRFQKLMSTRKTGSFSAEEDEIILEFKEKLDKNKSKLPALEFILRRPRKSILKRFDELTRSSQHLKTIEPILFVKNLMKKVNTKDINDLKGEIPLERWKEIGEYYPNIETTHLSNYWLSSIYPRLFSKEPIDQNEILQQIIKKISELNLNSSTQINWKELSESYESITPKFLQNCFNNACLLVPKENQDDFKYCVKFLKNLLDNGKVIMEILEPIRLI